jgi:monoterpene epsilon-lactone hydrolase
MHWRLQMADLAIRWRFKRHCERPIDVAWVRTRIGRPRWMRRVVTPGIDVVDVDLGGVSAEVLVPPVHAASAHVAPAHVAPGRVLLYVHGGGFIACSPFTHRPLAARLAREWEAIAVVPDYRLAPEHPFPAGRDDVLAVWRRLLDAGVVDPAHTVWAGDSAGGGLALTAALACADLGLPRPAALVTFSPWTDLACSGASLEENAARCAMFAPAQLREVARLYAGARDPSDPAVSPLHADLSTLPPLCVHASTAELLRDDATRLAMRAAAAGVPVSLRTWEDVPHVWQFLAGLLPEARESLDEAAAFVARHVPVRADRALRRWLDALGETRMPHA